jgi:hypothetical protein
MKSWHMNKNFIIKMSTRDKWGSTKDIKLILRDMSIDVEEVKHEFHILGYDDKMLMRNILN